jgi:hypothetical protein
MGCFEIMKHYTLRVLIHDAKIFNQLRLEYRRSNKKRHKDASSGWLSRYLAGHEGTRASLRKWIRAMFAIPNRSRCAAGK